MRSLVLTALLSWDTARGEVSVGVCLRMCGVGVGGERERTEREDKYEEGRQRRVIAQDGKLHSKESATFLALRGVRDDGSC